MLEFVYFAFSAHSLNNTFDWIKCALFQQIKQRMHLCNSVPCMLHILTHTRNGTNEIVNYWQIDLRSQSGANVLWLGVIKAFYCRYTLVQNTFEFVWNQIAEVFRISRFFFLLFSLAPTREWCFLFVLFVFIYYLFLIFWLCRFILKSYALHHTFNRFTNSLAFSLALSLFFVFKKVLMPFNLSLIPE